MSVRDKDNDFINSTIGVTVPEFLEKYIDKKTITFYKIEVTNHFSKTNWTLEKRYSDFDSLNKALIKVLPSVPVLPPKTVFKMSSYESLTKRRLELEQYLQDCVCRKDVLNTAEFSGFLEIDKHSPELEMNAPKEISELHGLPLGVRDFYYSSEDEVLFMVCSEMSVVSRTDSRITNIKLPWEKKGEQSNVPIGSAFCYKVTRAKEGFNFIKTWAKAFPTQTGVLNWDPDSTTFSIGLDDGKIIFYKLQTESKFSEFEELCTIKPHKNRVMGLGFDVQNGYIYSCSSDKTFVVSDINYQSSMNEIRRDNFGFTGMVYDKPNSRIFLTNDGGLLSVYMTNSYPPVEVLTIQLSAKGKIRGLHINTKKFLLFTASTSGGICVCDLGLPGKEKFIKEISSFGGVHKLRVVKYISNSNEIITGDQSGRVTIWSLKDGQSIYAWIAHPKSAITQMYYDEVEQLLWTGAKDKSIKIWKIPEKWTNDEIAEFEKNEIKNLNNNIAMMKMQRTMTKRRENEDDSDSSMDDLNGWDYP